MNLEQETRFLIKKYNISANKNLGQNFLINENVIENIVECAQIEENDVIIEIGPGLGSLTCKLLEKAKKVIAIELDDRMINILKDRFVTYNNFMLIKNDVLKVDLNQIIEQEKKQGSNIKIVANLPYYITTPIIMKLLEDKLKVQSITVMAQKEVAQRLTAVPGEKNAGAITYSVYYYTNPKEIMSVASNSFIPEPQVDSEVIQLNIREKPPIELKSEQIFFKVIKASFMQRRKTLINGLTNAGIVSREKIKQILNFLNLSENVRGEDLSIEQFAKIANML